MYRSMVSQGYSLGATGAGDARGHGGSADRDQNPFKRSRASNPSAAAVAGASPSGSFFSTDSECLVDAAEHSSRMGASNSSEAAAPLECTESSTVFGVHMPDGGWFAKCRGCGWMTAHEHEIQNHQVPFCKRCQATYTRACPVMKSRMTDTLVYVHTAWLTAGL